MGEELTKFRTWCGDERFARFVEALESTGREKGRLAFWQEQLLDRYASESGTSLPRSVDGLLALLADVLGSAEADPAMRITGTGLQDRGAQRAALLAWAERRKASGLARGRDLEVQAEAGLHPRAVEEVKRLFLEDAGISGAYAGATISVRNRPAGSPTPATGMTIQVDERAPASVDGSVCLQWTIAPAASRRPWWKRW